MMYNAGASMIQRAPVAPATGTAGADQDLIGRVACGDEEALGAIYDRYARLIFAIALRITADRALAEEVLQDVFVSIWGSAAGFHPGASLSAWLIGIARHRAIDATRTRSFRARHHERVLDPDLPLCAPELTDEQVDRQLMGEQVRASLAALSTTQREAIELAYYAGLTHSEIAGRLGLPLGTVKTRLRTGVLRLRELLRTPE